MVIEGTSSETTDDNILPTARCIRDTKERRMVTITCFQRLRCCVCHLCHKAMNALAAVGQLFKRVLYKKCTTLRSMSSLEMPVRQRTGITKSKNIKTCTTSQLLLRWKRCIAIRKVGQFSISIPGVSDTELFGRMDMKLNEGKYNNLSYGRYEKTIYVKTWTGRTVSLETDLNRAVETVKRQLEAKTGIPKDHQHLVSRGKVLTDDRTLKDCYISGGETIEMTALLLEGTKHKSLSTTPMDADRDKKEKRIWTIYWWRRTWRREAQTSVRRRGSYSKKWIKSVMKELKERTDDVSDFERLMTNSTAWNERRQIQYEHSGRGALQNIRW